MNAGVAAKDHGFIQSSDPVDAHSYSVDRDIQGTGDMALVEFIGGAQVYDNAALL